MANDLYPYRGDWSLTTVSGASTIAGGSGLFADDVRVTDIDAYREAVGEQTVQEMLAPLDEDERAEVDALVDALPETIREAIKAELKLGSYANARPASQAQIDRLTAGDEGQEVLRAFRGRAPQKFGIVLLRIRNIREKLSAADDEKFWGMVESLTSKERVSFLKKLGR